MNGGCERLAVTRLTHELRRIGRLERHARLHNESEYKTQEILLICNVIVQYRMRVQSEQILEILENREIRNAAGEQSTLCIHIAIRVRVRVHYCIVFPLIIRRKWYE